ncbi:hypothetical protein ACH4E5_06505 [Streptomyces afghaniensis]|uniref:hypothetical protein n=1 Tax=Streptomyces afghaniensis TaxID=66865 RepID=UPI0037B20E01
MGWLHSSLRRATVGEPGYVRLYELHVYPEFRQRGVARALVDELFAPCARSRDHLVCVGPGAVRSVA